MSRTTNRRVVTATTATVRDINRSIVLNLVRLEQPISRADLSRRTGMFHSNVSSIVDALVREGFLSEEPAAATARGRRPTHVRLNDAAHSVLGVYIQPSITWIAFASLRGIIKEQWSIATDPDPARFVEKLAMQIGDIRKAMGIERLETVALGVPGLVNTGNGAVLWSPFLPAYSGFDLACALQDAIGVPVLADNDSNLGALSELRLEEADGKHKSTFAVLSIGDRGVGGGFVVGGELYKGHDGRFAGEFGHMIVDPFGEPCNCGRRGCWETYISNEAIWRRYRPDRPFCKEHFLQFLDDASSGAPDAVAALRQSAYYIALGLSNIAFALNPGTVVVAGDVTKAWDLIQSAMAEWFVSRHAKVKLRCARMQGERSLLHGAVCLALNSIFARPHV